MLGVSLIVGFVLINVTVLFSIHRFKRRLGSES